MNSEVPNGDRSWVSYDRRTIAISIPQTRRRSIDAPFWIFLTTLPILLLGMPAQAVDRPLTAVTPNILSSLPRIAAAGGENILFPISVSARGEDDDKCIWLGICN